MNTVVGTVNESTKIPTTADDVSWHTTQESLTPEEEDAIITVIVVVVGIVAAIVILFSMGIFIDCRHQKPNDGKKKKRLRLKVPALSHRGQRNEDGKSLASAMCPTGNSELSFTTNNRDGIV